MSRERNTLISVSDKTGIVEYAQGISELGWTIYSSGGTATTINNAGVEAIDIEEIVGPPVLSDRVKTLSRHLHGGLLAIPDNDKHIEDLEEMGAPYLDMVVVDMYPLRETIASGASEAEVTENTDVGGPTMLHSAAKGRRIVLSRAEQRQPILDWLREGMPDEENIRRTLAATAEMEVAMYTLASARYLGELSLKAQSTYHKLLQDIAYDNSHHPNFFRVDALGRALKQ